MHTLLTNLPSYLQHNQSKYRGQLQRMRDEKKKAREGERAQENEIDVTRVTTQQ